MNFFSDFYLALKYSVANIVITNGNNVFLNLLTLNKIILCILGDPADFFAFVFLHCVEG